MTEKSGSWAMRNRDRNHVWHTWSPHAIDRSEMMFLKADGVRLWDTEGREFIDCSALNSTVGYGRGEVMEAIARQLARLPGVDISIASHDAAGELAGRLAAISPPGMRKFLFVNSGSEAWDAAIFAAASYWAARGEARRRFVAFRAGYQGSTIGARSLSGLPRVDHPLRAPFDISFVDLPCAPKDMRSAEALRALIAAFEAAIRLEDGPPAAVIVEPMLNVGGGIVLPGNFLPELSAVCARSDTLLAVDEVFTGYGRCGSMLMTTELDARAEIVVSSKGMAGGYVPIAALGVSECVYEAIGGDGDFGGLRYGHTTSGHAVACAAAVATLDIIEREDLCGRAQAGGERLRRRFAPLVGTAGMIDVRGRGQATAIEFASPQRAEIVAARARACGVLVRQPHSHLLVCPPLTVSDADLDLVAETLCRAVEETC